MAKKTKSAGKTRKAPKPAKAARAPRDAKPHERDPRLPAAGTVLKRPYKGTEHKVTVLEQGFRWDGKEWRSLSALAAAITGYRAINGFLWFGLTEREEPDAKPKAGKKRGVAVSAAEPAPDAAPERSAATD